MQLERGARGIIQLALLLLEVDMSVDRLWENTKGAA